jgi:hypothetical protein
MNATVRQMRQHPSRPQKGWLLGVALLLRHNATNATVKRLIRQEKQKKAKQIIVWNSHEDFSPQFLDKHRDLMLYDTWHRIKAFLLFPLNCMCRDRCQCDGLREKVVLSLNMSLYNKAKEALEDLNQPLCHNNSFKDSKSSLALLGVQSPLFCLAEQDSVEHVSANKGAWKEITKLANFTYLALPSAYYKGFILSLSFL